MVRWMAVNESVWNFWLEPCNWRAVLLPYFFLFLFPGKKFSFADQLVFAYIFTSLLAFSFSFFFSSPALISFPPSFTQCTQCSLFLMWDDSYPCLIPLTVRLCLTFPLPFTCTVPLCVLACAYVCKHVSDLPWGRLFLSSPQGAAFLTPYLCSLSLCSPPLSLSVFSPLCCLSLEGDWRVVVFPVGQSIMLQGVRVMGELEDGHFEALPLLAK